MTKRILKCQTGEFKGDAIKAYVCTNCRKPISGLNGWACFCAIEDGKKMKPIHLYIDVSWEPRLEE